MKPWHLARVVVIACGAAELGHQLFPPLRFGSSKFGAGVVQGVPVFAMLQILPVEMFGWYALALVWAMARIFGHHAQLSPVEGVGGAHGSALPSSAPAGWSTVEGGARSNDEPQPSKSSPCSSSEDAGA